MKIRVVKCSVPESWYEELIGMEFHVIPYDSELWGALYPFEFWNLPIPLLLKTDCEEIKDE